MTGNYEANLPPGVRVSDLPGWGDEAEECWDCGLPIEGKSVEVVLRKNGRASVTGTICEDCTEKRKEEVAHVDGAA